MSLPTLHYRLRIRDHEDTADSLILSSVPTDEFPYIKEPPTGDGQTLDPVTGKVSVGAYTVRVIDAVTSIATPSNVATHGFEYVDTAALLTSWPETDPDGFATVTLDTTLPHSGDGAGKWVSAAGGPYSNSAYIEHTFTNFTPGADVFVTLWVKPNRSAFGGAPAGDFHGFTANGAAGAIPFGASAGLWTRLSAAATVDGSGHVVIRIGAFIASPATVASPDFSFIFDDLTIAETGTIESRVVTAALADQDARQDLLSRKAYIEESLDGGLSWDVLSGGYINRVALADAITYEFTVGESKRIEQSTRLFDRITDPNLYPAGIGVLDRTCCILGGPIVGDFSLTADRGRPTYRTTGAASTITDPAGIDHVFIQMEWVSGFLYHGAFHEGSPPLADSAYKFLNNAALDYVAGDAQFTITGGVKIAPMPGMVARLYDPGTHLWSRDLTPWARSNLAPKGNTSAERLAAFKQDGTVFLEWPGDVAAPSAGTRFAFAMFPAAVSDRNPIHLSGHPVDIYTALADSKGIDVDTASAASVKTALGDVTVDFRITKGATFEDWVTTNLFGPFGFTTRPKGDGTRELITTRIRPTAPPDFTLVVDNLTSDDGPGWELDETSAAAKVTLDTKSYRFDDTQESSVAIDSLAEADIHTELTPQDPITVFGDREITFTFPGKIRGLEPGTPVQPGTLDLWAANQYGQLFDWMGRGQILGTFHALRGLDALVGDEINVQVAYVPTAAVGDVPTSQRGSHARRAQILRRTETPTGPTVFVLDRGPGIDDPGVIYDPNYVNSVTQCTAYDAPTGLAGVVNGTSVALTWTNGETDLPVEVLYKLTTATIYTLATTLPAGSTAYTLTLGEASTDYDIAVQHREAAPGLCTSDPDEITVTTDDLLVLQPPTDPSPFADGRGAYGLRVTAVELAAAVEVYFAPETAVGSATAGSYTLLATVPSVAGFDATVANAASLWPNDGTLVFLKARHVQSGFTPSDYTDEVSVNPWAIIPPTPEPPVDPTDPPIGLTVLTVPVTLVTGTYPMALREVPAEATALTEHRGTEKQIPAMGITSAYVGASIVSTTAPVGCTLAIQYEDPVAPDTWYFLDGTSGPVLAVDEDALDALDPGGAARSPKCWVVRGQPVAIAEAAAQDGVRYRAVIFGGTGAECVVVSELTVWLTTLSADAPESEPKDPPLENPEVPDPCAASGGVEGFDNYTDTADLEADWTINQGDWSGSVLTLDPTGDASGGPALKLTNPTGTFGGHQGPYVDRVLTGLPPGEAVLSGRAKILPSEGIGTGNRAPQAASIFNTSPDVATDVLAVTTDWQSFTTPGTVTVLGDGQLTIRIGWGAIPFFTARAVEQWYDNLTLTIDGVVVDICGGSGTGTPGSGTGLGGGDDPIPDPPGGGYPPPPVGGARPFGTFNIPAAGLGFWNLSQRHCTPSNIDALLTAAEDAGGYMMVLSGAGEANWKTNVSGPNGTFVYDLWKASVDAIYNNAAARAALEARIASGVAWAHWLIDEPFQKGPRYGGTVPLATVERMAQYSKWLYPAWPTIITTDLVQQSWYFTRHVNGLDYVSSDYMLIRGDCKTWRDAVLDRADDLGHTSVLGPHYGAFDRAGSGRYITPSELRHYGGIIATPGGTGGAKRTAANFGWKYTSAMYGQAGFTDALKYVRDLYASFDP